MSDGSGNGDPRSLVRCWAKALEELAERAFDDGVDVENDPEIEEEVAAAAAGFSPAKHRRWKERQGFVDLEKARDEVRVNHTDVEVYDKEHARLGTGNDDPFVSNRHTRGEVR